MRRQNPLDQSGFIKQIATNKNLQKFVSVDFADHAACVVIVGDVCGIFGQQLADDLVDGVIALFIQRIKYTPENAPHILLVIAGDSKLNGIVCHGTNPLSFIKVL